MRTKQTFLTAGILLTALSASFSQSTLQFSTNSYTVAEWAGTVSLTVRRTNDINTEASVDYATADGSATNGVKYIATNGTLVFIAGETNKAITVPILNEGLVEGIKTFTVTLRNPTNAVLGMPTNATVRILDIDSGIQFQFTNYNSSSGWPVPEDVGTFMIGVVRGDDVDLPVTVDIATSNLGALSGVDYVGFTNTLSFSLTERLKFVPVTILNDGLKETTTKIFRLTLSNPVGVSLGAAKTTSVSILDNDQGFQFQTNRYDVAEDSGVALVVVLRGTDDTNSTITAEVVTVNGTATYGQDYTGSTNTLSFAPGERRKVVAIPILNDGVKENQESFTLTLSNPTGGAVLGSPTMTSVYIRDNDPGVGFESPSYTNAWGQAADFAVTVLRGNDGALGPITVNYAFTDITATNGVDYQASPGTLTFQENETVKSLTVPLLRPRAVGSPKTFQATLSNPTGGATLGTAVTTVTIVGAYAAVAPPYDCALTIWREWGVNLVTWAGGGQLQRADKPTGPWQTLSIATNPCTVQSPVPTTFYRVARPRPARLYVPSSYTGQSNLPLVILLHGYSWDGVSHEGYMKFQPLAEARGFLYCCPDGTKDFKGWQFWNATESCCDFWSSGVDDAGYLRALIQEIRRRFAVDPKRIHLVGHSNGGFMAYRMARQSADLIAGIASLAGMTFLDTSYAPPSDAVNILHIHGTADQAIFYDGGSILSPPFWGNLYPNPGAVRTAQIRAGYNGCVGDPITGPAPALDLTTDVPGLDTTVMRYPTCTAGGAVELWTINGGSHEPVFSSEFSPRVIDWLLAHPKP